MTKPKKSNEYNSKTAKNSIKLTASYKMRTARGFLKDIDLTIEREADRIS